MLHSDRLTAWMRALAALPAAVMLAAATAGATSPPDRPAISIESGTVIGTTTGEVDQYLGIPYAAPPVGKLRWRPPVAVKRWSASRPATSLGSTCPQNQDLGPFATPGGAEDCLFLNITVPHASPTGGDKRRVMVWIHGGGLSVGHSDGHDASRLALRGDAVVVTLNYRLGVLGFMAHSALDREGHAFANYGLMDQQFALRWVKRNIARFGGDPGNVTIFGESSGGTSVMSQIVSPGAASLFQHAIAQSGAAIMLKYPAFGAPHPLDDAREIGRKFAAAAGCADQSAVCLRRLPVATILKEQAPYTVNQAIIDGQVLPIPYTQAIATGAFNHVTFMNGSTHDEWRWLAGFVEAATGKPMTAEGYATALGTQFGPALTPRVLAEYPITAYLHPALAFSAAVTDSLFACTARRLNQLMAPQTPTYAFEFADDTAPSYLAPTSFPLGAAHTLEIQYLFPGYHGGSGTAHELNAYQRQLSDRMIDYWTSLDRAAAGAPWPVFAADQDNYMSLVAPEPAMRSHRFALEHHCAFWDATGIY